MIRFMFDLITLVVQRALLDLALLALIGAILWALVGLLACLGSLIYCAVVVG